MATATSSHMVPTGPSCHRTSRGKALEDVRHCRAEPPRPSSSSSARCRQALVSEKSGDGRTKSRSSNWLETLIRRAMTGTKGTTKRRKVARVGVMVALDCCYTRYVGFRGAATTWTLGFSIMKELVDFGTIEAEGVVDHCNEVLSTLCCFSPR